MRALQKYRIRCERWVLSHFLTLHNRFTWSELMISTAFASVIHELACSAIMFFFRLVISHENTFFMKSLQVDGMWCRCRGEEAEVRDLPPAPSVFVGNAQVGCSFKWLSSKLFLRLADVTGPTSHGCSNFPDLLLSRIGYFVDWSKKEQSNAVSFIQQAFGKWSN